VEKSSKAPKNRTPSPHELPLKISASFFHFRKESFFPTGQDLFLAVFGVIWSELSAIWQQWPDLYSQLVRKFSSHQEIFKSSGNFQVIRKFSSHQEIFTTEHSKKEESNNR
jgi:hypothetical protein